MPFDINALSLLSHAVESPASRQPTTANSASNTSFWHELVARIAADVGIDPQLAVGVASQESGLNPAAFNRSSGAIGIMQLMPETAAALGVDPHDAMANIVGGVRYLREQLQSFGDKAKALAAYNWGPRHVADAVERWGSEWLQHAPGETQRYVASILARTGSGTAAPITASEPPSGNSLVAESGSPTSGGHGDPALLAEAINLRSAMNAYLLSEVLD
jgi:soluble lytic murein transglycosylase-like protein